MRRLAREHEFYLIKVVLEIIVVNCGRRTKAVILLVSIFTLSFVILFDILWLCSVYESRVQTPVYSNKIVTSRIGAECCR